MEARDRLIGDFMEALASKAAVPGGGGASALCGALGAALASMVGNLTAGKKKYAQYEGDIQLILEKAERLREELLGCIDRDAEGFEPLSRAYSIPKDDPSRAEVMEGALRDACEPPMEIMRLAAEALELHEELLVKGSRIMLSDVGVGALCCRAALMGGSLNVFTNTKLMGDRERAAEFESEAKALLDKYVPMADRIFDEVKAAL